MRKQLSILDRVLRHNLRNELNIIAGWVETTASQLDTTGDTGPLEVVDRHLDRLEGLSETARQIRAVFDTDTRTRFDVAEVVGTAVSDVTARAAGVAIETSLPATAPVLAHPQIETAVRELLENAIQHNDTDFLRIEVDVTPTVDRPDGSQMCRIDIHDTGQGIPRQEIEALTQAEERALSHGRGLGLWLVSAVLEQSGGQLEFPDTGNGTTVRLWLPGP